MMKEVYIIEFNSFEEMMDFLEWLMNDEPQACDDAQEAWATEKEHTRDDKIEVAQFARVLN